MKVWIRYFLGINASLVIIIFLQLDPFTFFPKSYAQAPPFLLSEIDQITEITVDLEANNQLTTLALRKSGIGWFLRDLLSNADFIGNSERVSIMLANLLELRRFENDSKLMEDSEFWGEEKLSIHLSRMGDKIINLQFGKCYQLNSECLVREENSKKSYTIPISIWPVLSDLRPDAFLTKAPLVNIRQIDVIGVKFSLSGKLIYELMLENNKWNITPELDGEINPLAVQNFIERLLDFAGDDAVSKENVPLGLRSVVPLQSITVKYMDDKLEKKEIILEDLGNTEGDKKMLAIRPFDQYILIPSYSWEYWRFFDTRQLLRQLE
jgi:hypothetical protein